MDVQVNLKGIKLVNPVILASGTCGYAVECAEIFNVQKVGAFISKGTTLNPKDGNAQVRIAETSCGMLNAVGLENIGLKRVVEEKAPLWAKFARPVIVNVAGSTIDEYLQVVSTLSHTEGVAGIELNISCPNVRNGCIEFGSQPQIAAELVKEVRKVCTLPLLIKLTPNTALISEVAMAVMDAGADGVSLINTIRGMAVDIKRRKALLSNTTGGLSGPAIKPVALAHVYNVRKTLGRDALILGGGGIMNGLDAIEFIMAGANAVSVGTAFLRNPNAAIDIAAGIEDFMYKEGIKSLNEICSILI
ncbi:MAG: dihydroorotate dehydrogenase [Chloroflexi bacterium]|nr:dihydroorotate dehydrogenase [Chloroflexota bacterium]